MARSGGRRREASSSRRNHWTAVICLLVLAPVCAEYLAAYDDSTGDLGALLLGLAFFVPLYGCPALLIREVARRTRMTWIGVVALATGSGIVQAGLVDQSVFRLTYRDLPAWADWATPTYIEPFGLSAYLALTFVSGHVIASFCAPIAISEALVPGQRTEAWLGPVGLGVTAGLYLTAAGVILDDHLATESAAISPAQLVVTSLIVVALVVFAATVGRARLGTTDRWCPPALVLFVAVAAFGVGKEYLPVTWPGVAAHAALLAGVAGLVLWFARSTSWSRLHELSVAAGFVTALAIGGFMTTPLFGEVPALQKYVHSTVLAVAIAALVLVGLRATARDGGSPPAAEPDAVQSPASRPGARKRDR
jgi:hypothetical protein